MKILFDTNTVLDLLLDREPFVDPVAQLFSLVERGDLLGCLGATTITTLYYLASKVMGRKTAQKEIQKLLVLFEIAPVNHPVLQAALQSGFPDFEDGVIHEAARFTGADGIVTRDPKGFKKAEIRIYSPEELIQELIKSLILTFSR
jgi:predicted nucleic acid-binding protein